MGKDQRNPERGDAPGGENGQAANRALCYAGLAHASWAAGAAHELNNPLNNVGLSAQALAKELGSLASASVTEIVGDIASQTVRVKDIVADLLEFARERELQIQDVELRSLVARAYELARAAPSSDIERAHGQTPSPSS